MSDTKWITGKFEVTGRTSARQGATVEVPVDATEEVMEAALRAKAVRITPRLGRLVDGPKKINPPASTC